MICFEWGDKWAWHFEAGYYGGMPLTLFKLSILAYDNHGTIIVFSFQIHKFCIDFHVTDMGIGELACPECSYRFMESEMGPSDWTCKNCGFYASWPLKED